jgi:hypothetical protein
VTRDRGSYPGAVLRVLVLWVVVLDPAYAFQQYFS